MRRDEFSTAIISKPWLKFLAGAAAVAASTSLLISCSGTDSQMIHLTGQGGGTPTTVNKDTADANQPLAQKDLKLRVMQELMRYHASSKYLINPPAATAAAFDKGCVNYQPSNLEDRNLRATYACDWLQTSRDGKRQLQWVLTKNEDFAPAAATDQTKTVEAKATLTLNAQSVKTHTLRRSEAYTRDTKITPKDATNFAIKGQSGVSPATSAATGTTQELVDDINTPSGYYNNLPPHHPVPRPTPTSKSTDSWVTTIDGYWQKDTAALEFEKGGELTITYKASASDDPVVLTLFTTSAITFNEADGACPLPTGTLSWSSQTGTAAAVTGTLSLDASGINDKTGGTDAVPWPTESCLEFTAAKAQ